MTLPKDATPLPDDSVFIGIFDRNAEFRAKKVSYRSFKHLLDSGYHFCNVLYNWDAAERPFSGGGFPDVPAAIDPSSLRLHPFFENAYVCLAEFTGAYGEQAARNQLAKQIAKAEQMGLKSSAAFEFEFMVLDETPASVREKGFRNLTHFAPANRTYSMQSSMVYDELFTEFQEALGRSGINFYAVHSELGPGTFEVPLAHADSLKAADDAALFKTFTKAFFLRQGKMATFLAKFSEHYSGQSGHLHLSLRDSKTGKSCIVEESNPEQLTDTARWFIGGLVRLLPDAVVLCSHTVNAYRRMVPGAWAPTSATWGMQDRTAAVRVINDDPASARIEFRVPAADTNPHAALALFMGAGLWGIENRIEPGPPNVEGQEPEAQRSKNAFPSNLRDAVERLDRSAEARSIFGDAFIDSFVKSQLVEVLAYERHVTGWERERYLDIS